jgi:hypothetical protein
MKKMKKRNSIGKELIQKKELQTTRGMDACHVQNAGGMFGELVAKTIPDSLTH